MATCTTRDVGGTVGALATAVLLLFLCLLTAPAHGQSVQVGPNAAIALEALDTPGAGRTNIDQSNSQLLQPGTYRATTFFFASGQAGDVTPFLAASPTSSDPTDAYTTLAVGQTRTTGPGQNVQSVGFGGSDTFTLPEPTRVYAGITSADASSNPIYFDDGVASTDHDGTDLDPDRFTAGGAINGFSDPNLNRIYAFAIDVTLVPEPSTAVIAAAALGLITVATRTWWKGA